MFLALKEMKKEKSRFFLIISIVVLISYLVYFLIGLAYGLAVDNTTAVDLWKADQIVLTKSSNKNISSSMMNKEDIINALGDTNYSLINLGRSSAYINGDESDDKTISIAVIGTDKDSKIAPQILEGKMWSKNGEAVASISLKEEQGLKLGDTIKVAMNNKDFKVVGFTNEAKFNTSPAIYTDLKSASAASMIFTPEEKATDESVPKKDKGESNTSADTTSQATKSAPERVAGAIIYGNEKLDLAKDFEAISIKDFIVKIPGYYAQVLTFGLMIGFLVLITSIVLGVFLFIITIQKKQTFGIMKIQGISNGFISKSVILQTLIVTVIGLAIGLILTYLTKVFLPVSVPFKINVLFLISITLLMIITSLLGSLFSVKSVSKVDPLEVLE